MRGMRVHHRPVRQVAEPAPDALDAVAQRGRHGHQIGHGPAQLLGDLVRDRAVALDRQRIAADRRRARLETARQPSVRSASASSGQRASTPATPTTRPPTASIASQHAGAGSGLHQAHRSAAPRARRTPRATTHSASSPALAIVTDVSSTCETARAANRSRQLPARVAALVLDDHPPQAELLAERGRRHERRVALAHRDQPVARDRQLGGEAGQAAPVSLPGLSDATRAVHGRDVATACPPPSTTGTRRASTRRDSAAGTAGTRARWGLPPREHTP